MNKKVISILLLAVLALIVLTLYSFGPLASQRKSASINPASINPQSTGQVSVNNQQVTFSSYHNKDVKENYYTFNLPQDWQVKSGQNPGSYSFDFPQGNGKVELQDVADNTTLELFVLSQAEPQLKKASANYQRIDYKKLSVNNNDAYQLLYQSTVSGEVYQTLKTYITGLDHAAVITLSIKQTAFNSSKSLFDDITNSFQWENK